MPRATTRSQRPPRASQSNTQPGRSQRARRPGDDSDDPDDGEGDEYEGGDDDEHHGGSAAMDTDGDLRSGDGDTEINRKANDLVRLALFTEHKRTPLRREDITKKVLGSNARLFNRVFERAQGILKKTFGMEFVELQSRALLDQDANTDANEDDLNEARKATGVKKKAASAGSKTYIIRSVLHPTIIEYAALTDEQILEEEAADAPSDEDDDDNEFRYRSYGSIISWSTADQLGPTGVLYVILALILVSGRVISDMDLRSNLKRLRLPSTGTLAFNAQSTHRTLPIDQYLTNLIRQGYLDRQQIGDAKKGGDKGKGRKRGRATQADEEAGTTYEWRWGNRAQSEVGEKGIAQFVAEFMVGVEDADDGDDDEEEGGGGSRNKSRQKQASMEAKLAKMTKGIEKAAGGQLADLK